MAVALVAACGGDDGSPSRQAPPQPAFDAAPPPEAPGPRLDGRWIGDAARADQLARIAEVEDPEERADALEQMQAELPAFEIEFSGDVMTQRFDGEVVKQGRYELVERRGERWVLALSTDAGVDEGIFLLEDEQLTLVSADGDVGMVLRRR